MQCGLDRTEPLQVPKSIVQSQIQSQMQSQRLMITASRTPGHTLCPALFSRTEATAVHSHGYSALENM